MKRKAGGRVLGKQLVVLPQTGREMRKAAAQGQPQMAGIDLRQLGVFISLH